MNLIKATAFCVQTPPPHLGGYNWYFVKLETDSGLVGWGECAVLFSMYGLEKSFEALVEDNFARYLAGQNPLNREVLTKTMYEGLTSMNPGYFTAGIISAFDMAMWDIAGKHLDAPVCDLLGGRFRDRVRTYTYIYNLDAGEDLVGSLGDWLTNPKRVAESARKIVDQGFTGIKLDPVPYVPLGMAPLYPTELTLQEYDNAERTIEAIRKEVGNEADILSLIHI